MLSRDGIFGDIVVSQQGGRMEKISAILGNFRKVYRVMWEIQRHE